MEYLIKIFFRKIDWIKNRSRGHLGHPNGMR